MRECQRKETGAMLSTQVSVCAGGQSKFKMISSFNDGRLSYTIGKQL